MAQLQLLGQAERKVIAKEIQRLRNILTAIEQLEQCGEECSDQRLIVQQLWKRYTDLLKNIYQETPEQPPWQAPTGNGLASATS
jgi:hypothetical protein